MEGGHTVFDHWRYASYDKKLLVPRHFKFVNFYLTDSRH